METWLIPALAAAVLWGIVGLLQKLGSNRMDPTSLLVWVTVGYIAAVPMFVYGAGLAGLSPRQSMLGIAAGAVNGLGTWCLFASLESGAKASIAIPLTALYPVVTLVLAFVLLSERLTPHEWLGVLLAFAGGAMLSYEKPVTQAPPEHPPARVSSTAGPPGVC